MEKLLLSQFAASIKSGNETYLPMIDQLLKDIATPPEQTEMHRVASIATSATTKKVNLSASEPPLEDGEFAMYVTTRALDRDREIVMSEGIDTKEWQLTGVIVQAHNYSELPIGKATWMSVDDVGLKVHIIAAPTERGEELAALAKFMPLTASIGFVPVELVRQGSPEYKKAAERIAKRYPNMAKDVAEATSIILKSRLFEISIAAVPTNPFSATTALAKSLARGDVSIDESTVIRRKLPAVFRGVIPWSAHGNVPHAAKNVQWSAAAEMAAATPEQLRRMCAWFDSAEPELKSSYKLAHHKADTGCTLIPDGVEYAMAELLGARGGVDISDIDKQGVYEHLSKEYKVLGMTPPVFKPYTQAELKELFKPRVEPTIIVINRHIETVQRSIEVLSRPIDIDVAVKSAVGNMIEQRLGIV